MKYDLAAPITITNNGFHNDSGKMVVSVSNDGRRIEVLRPIVIELPDEDSHFLLDNAIVRTLPRDA